MRFHFFNKINSNVLTLLVYTHRFYIYINTHTYVKLSLWMQGIYSNLIIVTLILITIFFFGIVLLLCSWGTVIAVHHDLRSKA